MEERIELVVQEKQRPEGVSFAIAFSFIVHSLLIVWVLFIYKPEAVVHPETPMLRYVELIRQNSERQFTEAPGPRVDSAPLNAPFSDANRRASMPEPTGTTPTTRPGDDRGLYVPPMEGGDGRPRAAEQPTRTPQQASMLDTTPSIAPQQSDDTFVYRESKAAQASTGVDWRSAIREAGKIASLGTGEAGLDLGNVGGGEKGFAESGPLSFETQWYDWGEYAQSMVSRIRVNWYDNMPQLIRTGMGGVVTIRFTIQRGGRITDIVMLKSSGIPPYDYAAKKAIELSSPLNPLPKDFPNASERVTCMFYYNMQVPNN